MTTTIPTTEIRAFVAGLLPTIDPDDRVSEDDEGPCLQLTVSCDDACTVWGAQTGDNSFTGGAYGLPHWAVVTIAPDSDPDEITAEIFAQWAELRPED